MNTARIKKEGLSLLLMIVIGGAFYVGLQFLQNWNGKRAFAATGLTPLTLAEAQAKAQAEGKLVLADLSAYWCGYCIKLDRKVFADENIQKHIQANYIYARIDSESEEAADFQKRYQATGYPTVVVLKPNGELVNKLQIIFDPEEFIKQI